MDKWPTEQLIAEIGRLEGKLTFYQAKLGDLVSAYKSLLNEKEALESSVKALKNVCARQTSNSPGPLDNNVDSDSTSSKNENEGGNFHSEITTLMNSLATLSAEKCRMEASFQADKKLLRQDKEKNESLIRDLQEKLKKTVTESSKEIEHLKSKLIIANHEREKQQNEHSVMLRELQRLLSEERDDKVALENKLSELMPKLQMLENKEETERFSQSDMSEKFLQLQKQHLATLEKERKRVQQMEQESKEQTIVYESKIADLETRIGQLSQTVAEYHKSEQQYQIDIAYIKSYVENLMSVTLTAHSCNVPKILENRKNEQNGFENEQNDNVVNEQNGNIANEQNGNIGNEVEVSKDLKVMLDSKLFAYQLRLDSAKTGKTVTKPADKERLFDSKEVQTISFDKHNVLMHDQDKLQKQCTKCSKILDENESLKIKIQVLVDQNTALNDQIEETVHKYQKEFISCQELVNALKADKKKEINDLHSYYKGQIIELENQLEKQRDRTVALINEKDEEIQTLKSSFQVFVPGNQTARDELPDSQGRSQLAGVLDNEQMMLNFDNVSFDSGGSTERTYYAPGMNFESPHIVYYASELARKDIQIANLHSTLSKYELSLHENKKELFLLKEKYREEVNILKQEIARLNRCQTREGANLEYLKNVIVNYFLSKNASSKGHMFNAIAAVLKFSEPEIEEIKKHF